MQSNTVGEAFKRLNFPEMEKTVEFVLAFDKFFDCLNVKSLEAGKRCRNAFKAPYRDNWDFRIEVKCRILQSLAL